MRELESKQPGSFPTRFIISSVKQVYDNAFEQAAYAYSLIESEAVMDGTQ